MWKLRHYLCQQFTCEPVTFRAVHCLMKNMRYLLFVLGIFNFLNLSAQNFVRGVVTDERNVPIPFAKIFVKNDAENRTVADVNGRYEMSLLPGEYFLIFSSMGFDDREGYISISNKDLEKNMQLFPSKFQELDNIDITVKKTNPGRDIMLEVVKKREKINPWNYPHTVDVYIKATEKLDRKEKEKSPSNTENTSEADPLSDGNKKEKSWLDNMNLVEVQLNRNYAPGNKVKEIRNAYTLRGNAQSLYYTTTVKSNFNFFENLLHLDDLHQTPVSSPISNPGILSYKYRLEKQYEENGRKISKIKISARNTATTTLEGYIWVIDSVWLVQKLELTMNKGNLLVYDYFTIIQEFEHPGDSLCVLTNQTLNYGVKYKNETSKCVTQAIFSNYNFNASFANKFFNTELAVTEKEAYERDTAYWSNKRVGTLTEEERKFIIAKDSIRDFQNRKEYLDSIDKVFNKITALKVLWFGIDHRNRPKRYQWTIGSLATFIQPVYIAGPRLTPSFDFFKKWKDERTLDSYTRISYGFLNQDWKGDTWWKYKFDPFHLGYVRASLNHDFDVIRGFDAITQIYKRNNFIETTKMRLSFEYELLNGLYFSIDGEMAERRSVKDYKFVTIFNNVLPNDDPIPFTTYQAFVSNIFLSFVPKQKYMREPYRKVILGSAFPTFTIGYQVGVPRLFGSDINFNYLQGEIKQTFKIGTLGTTSYRLAAGKFLTSAVVREPDYKFQRRSDPIWFSNPLYSFQGLDSTLATKDVVYEFHFVHHDNGAILNKIPFMKKTRIGLVAGGGAMYVKEHDWFHYEFLAGLERNFKLSRRRLRVGIYGVFSDGNRVDPRFNYKISFAVLDDRSMKWNF
ncbi:MAG: hypothetical protein RL264_671 [Bacteroidota bacterium]